MKNKNAHLFLLALVIGSFSIAISVTDPNDFAVLDSFRKGIKNNERLGWPASGNDPCGPPTWTHISCTRHRVTSIQVKNLGLIGTLPSNINNLSELKKFGIQRNNFTGTLPSFRNLSKLENIYIDKNQFSIIPIDFFQGLTSLREVSLDHNPLNASGWSIPPELKNSLNLSVLRLSGCNLVGNLPDFLGSYKNLTSLQLSHNCLNGHLPTTFRGNSKIEVLKLNDQAAPGLNGSVDVIASMAGLKQAWLHLNQFTGNVPEGMEGIKGLTELLLYRNKFTGLVPKGLTMLQNLTTLDLSFNDLSPPLPKFRPTVVVTVRGNPKFGK